MFEEIVVAGIAAHMTRFVFAKEVMKLVILATVTARITRGRTHSLQTSSCIGMLIYSDTHQACFSKLHITIRDNTISTFGLYTAEHRRGVYTIFIEQ
jgi:hypothetical protein